MALRPLALLAIPLIALMGCDTASVTQTQEPGTALMTEDAARAVATALGGAPGGALHDLAEATAALDIVGTAAWERTATPGCSADRTFDAAAEAWTQTVSCERTSPNGAHAARFARTHIIQLRNGAGSPVARPARAAEMVVDLLSAEGMRHTPQRSHVLTGMESTFTVAGLDRDEVTVNGTFSRSAMDSVRVREALRTVSYTVDFAFENVTGPRRAEGGTAPRPAAGELPLAGLHRQWAHATGGTVSGHLTGLVTVENRNGTRSREVERAFTLTFEGDGTAVVRFGRTPFQIDLEAGELIR